MTVKQYIVPEPDKQDSHIILDSNVKNTKNQYNIYQTKV